MKRKVTLHGPATLSVSLPLKWARMFNIKKGDELEVSEQKESLLISLSKIKDKKKEIDVVIPAMEGRSILFLIRNLYINGYDTINLKFEKETSYHSRRKINMTMLNLVSREANRLIGFAITDIGKKSCTLKCLAKESIEEFDVAIKRVFTIIDLSLKEAAEIIKNKSSKQVEQLSEDVHNQVTKLLAYNLRTLNKIGYKDKETTLKMYNLLYRIDDFLDHIKYWLREISIYTPIKNKEILNITDNFNEHFGNYFKLFYKFNLESYSRIFEESHIIRDQIIKAESKLNIKEKRYLSHLESMLEELLKLTITRMSLEY